MQNCLLSFLVIVYNCFSLSDTADAECQEVHCIIAVKVIILGFNLRVVRPSICRRRTACLEQPSSCHP